MTRGIRLTGLLALALLAALVVFLSTDDTHATAPPFDPGGMTCLDTYETPNDPCDGDMSPGAASDIRGKFCVGWNEDCSVRDAVVNSSNTGGLVFFTPSEWTVPKGDTIPVGALAGRLDSEAWLGLLNNPCNNRIGPAFSLMNASINVNDQIKPREEGLTDVLLPLAADLNHNGIPDGADKYPSFLAEFFSANGQPIQPRARLFGTSNISGNWVTLNFVFFDAGQTLEIGQTVVTFNANLGTSAVTILNDPEAQTAPSAITDFCAPLLTQFWALGKTMDNPCTPTPGPGANCPIQTEQAPSEIISIPGEAYPSMPCDARSKFDDDHDGKINDGCPQVGATAEQGTQCDNDISDDTEDSNVNDGCPAVGDQSEGARIPGACSATDEGGCTNRANPATGGTYKAVTLALSQRDLDGDGYENGFDTCFDKANPEWNPRAPDPTNDTDLDGIPNVCDPDPAHAAAGSPTGCKSGYTGPDEDQDCFANRADTCFKDSNLKDPTKAADNFPETNANPPIAEDKDKDGIADACDPHPDAVDGDYTGVCLDFAMNIGGAPGPVTGVKESEAAPGCAAQIVSNAPTPPGQTASPRPSGASGSGNTGGGSSGVGGPSSGVGSLAPTGTDVPLWAAILAGLGAVGLVSGLALYARLAPRRQR